MNGVGVAAGTGGGRSGRLSLAVILLVYAAHAFYLSGLAEDAFISFRFARHLANGHGLAWNVGEPPVEGYTNFLWVLMSAAAFRLGLDVPRTAQAAGLAAGAVTIVLVYLAGRRVAGWPAAVALVPSIMLAASGPFATWSTSGMETVPFAALVLTGLVLFGDYWRSERRAVLVAASVALFTATLLRPEGALAFGLLGALGGAFTAGRPRRRWLDLLVAASCYLVPFALYLAWRFWYFGDLLPNTFYAKTGGGPHQWLRGGVFATGFVMQFVVPLVPWAMVALWQAAVRRRDDAAEAGRRQAGGTRALAAASALLFAGFTVYVVLVGGDYMAMHRFFVPVMPPLYLAAAAALASIAPHPAAGQLRRPFSTLVGLAVLFTILPSLPIENRIFFRSVHQHGNYQGVQVERWNVARLTVVGKFFDKYRKSPADTLATDAIGAIGYYADMPVYDFFGIVDPHIARAPIPPQRQDGMAGHQKTDFPYILSKKPTYLLFSRFLTASPGDNSTGVPDEIKAAVASGYEARSVWLTDTANGDAGYLTFMQRRGAAGSVY